MILTLRIILLAGWLLGAWLWFELLKDVGLPPKPASNDWVIPFIPITGALTVFATMIFAHLNHRKTATWITWLSIALFVMFWIATINAVFIVGSIRESEALGIAR